MSRFSQKRVFVENRGFSISRNKKSGHVPVLLNEVIECLNLQPGRKFIDATINGGGHVFAMLGHIVPGGKLLGIEWDGKLLKQLEFKVKSSKFKENVILVNDSYANLEKIAETNGFIRADGILFDLGMSSWHIEESNRGFTFQKDEPLDMRFNSAGPETAADILNKWQLNDIEKILKDYGEERFYRNIARAVIKERKEKPIASTFQLVEIIKNSVPFWYRRGRIHFATRTFQALRIAANNELENLQSGLEQAEKILEKGGRLAVISFHSLEDRIVKNFFREKAREGKLKILAKKPIRAGLVEITANPRARSAKLRVAEKI